MKRLYILFVFLTLLTINGFCQYKSNSFDSMKVTENNIGGRKIKMTKLNKKETKELITKFHGTQSANISKKHKVNAYLLNDKRLVLVHEGGGMLYQTTQDLEDLMSFLNKNSKPHPFYDGIPYGVYYLTHIDTIINEFSQKIGIPISELDKSIESLYKIESKLKALKLDAFELEKNWLIYVVTYCGEVIRIKTGGNWALHELRFEDRIVYEPYIVLENRREYTPLYGFLKEIHEHTQRLSIAITIEAEIGKYELYDFMEKNKK